MERLHDLGQALAAVNTAGGAEPHILVPLFICRSIYKVTKSQIR